jgi:hypothetical protein
MKDIKCFASSYMIIFLTENYTIMVNSDELIGTTEYQMQ